MKSPWGDEVVAGRYGAGRGHPGLVYRDRPLSYAQLFAGIDRWHDRIFLVQNVVEAAAIGLPQPELGEELAVVVVHRPGVPAPTAEELARHMSGEVAYFEIPTRWKIRTTPLPTVGTEKVDKKNLALEFP